MYTYHVGLEKYVTIKILWLIIVYLSFKEICEHSCKKNNSHNKECFLQSFIEISPVVLRV